MLKKLRIKFICFTMILVFLVLCVIFGMVYGFTARNLEADSLQLMHAMAGRPELPGEKKPSSRVPYLVLRQSAQGIWSAQGSDYYDLSDKEFLQALLNAVTASGDREGVLKEYNLRYLRMDGPSVRYIFMDISAERTTLQHLIRTCLIIGVISLIAFFAISLLLVNWALRPVEEAWHQQKQFVADASHELKTPLAVLLTNAELLNDADYSLQEQQQFRQNVLCMTLQMRNLVEGLLELTRLDNVTPALQPLNFSTLTENTLLPFEPVFFENEMILESNLFPELWVKGSEQHLRQLTEIFLDNALKYADPGSVTVILDRAGSHALLQVENQGVPLTSEESKNIFRRFYRTDPSRKRDGSYGLGLSIAQSIVQQHGGKIWAEGTATGNRFCALLPLCSREYSE